jgi:hypothetical protein
MSAYDSVAGTCVKQTLFACMVQSGVAGGASNLNPVRKEIGMVGNHVPLAVLAPKYGSLPCYQLNANPLTIVHHTFLDSLHDTR